MLENLWDDAHASFLGPDGLLVYRSRLIGREPSLVNYGGGNTSMKTVEKDHAGRSRQVLWIKGSGFDLAQIERGGFTRLDLADVRQARARTAMSDDEMADYLCRCALDPGTPQASIETMLHAFLPFPHVDHTHAEGALGFGCSLDGEEMAKACFGEEVLWVPYVRPGFRLAKLAMEAFDRNPQARGMLLAKHGLVTWGDSPKESYSRTVDIVQKAEAWLESKVDETSVFGGEQLPALPADRRREMLAELLPRLRGQLIKLSDRHIILGWDDSPDSLEFVSSRRMGSLAGKGAATPDHVLYSKFLPCAVDASPSEMTTRELIEAVLCAVDAYALEYQRRFGSYPPAQKVDLDSVPRLILIPGIGAIASGSDAWAAGNTLSLFRSAIRVMRWASSSSEYESLTDEEACEIEYWPLEMRKLALRPQPRELAGRVAVITGGAGGIGRGTAERLLQEDAHVVLADIDAQKADQAAFDLNLSYRERVQGMAADAAGEQDVARLTRQAVLRFGGIDIMIPNAGVSSAGPIEETTVDEWERVHDLMVRGYFFACRAAFQTMKAQGTGGSIVINGSKNGVAAGKNAIAYTTAKASEHHLARCLAEEGGPHGIRVNVVAPDAVIRGSGFWNREWVEQRARAYGFEPDEVEEYYRKRNVLGVKVTAEDVAEAILFLVSDRSSRTTGCTITVDGGLAVVYPR